MYKTAPWKHFKTVTQHRWYVFKNCCRVGMPIRGLLHDLSKYSPIEFGESMRYYSGDRSPIDNCKDEVGFSRAWMHHKGKNPHHWEYWIDNIDNGGEGHPVGTLMPYKYAAEMICDYLAAGQAYNKGYLNISNEWKWWQNKRQHCVMHPVIRKFVDVVFLQLKDHDLEGNRWQDIFNSTLLKRSYKVALEAYNNGFLD